MKQKKENGMTLIALAITIIVLAIIAAISITAGGNVIRASQLESLKTNMLLIQAKTKEYVEEVSFKRGPVHEADIENIRSYLVLANLIIYLNTKNDNSDKSWSIPKGLEREK